MLNFIFPSASAKYELASSVKQTSMAINIQMYIMLLEGISPNSSISLVLTYKATLAIRKKMFKTAQTASPVS
jgi:hypothetical protein